MGMTFNPHLQVLIVVASNAPVYTRRSLLGADGPQAPGASVQLRPMHKPPLASAGLSILGREGTFGGSRPWRAHGCRQAVPPSRPSRWWVSALLAEGL